MKRPKSKRFKRQRDMVKAAVFSIRRRERDVCIKEEEERAKDEEFFQKNRLEIEMNRRCPV